MRLEDVLNYYGTAYEMEKKHKLAHQNVSNWKRLGYIPIMTQMKIERLTNGELKADLSHCPKE